MKQLVEYSLEDGTKFLIEVDEPESTTVEHYAVNVLSRELGLEINQTPVAEALERISSLEKRMEKLESTLLGVPQSAGTKRSR